MHLPKSERFLEEIMSYIKFPFDKDIIKKEIYSHMIDKVEYYIGMGYDNELAEQQAIADMGDAKEIGKALNKQHNPIIGWLWKISNVLVIMCILFNLFFVGLPIILTLFWDNPVNDIQKSDIVYSIAVNKTVQIDDQVITFTNVTYEKNKKLSIIYECYDKGLWRSGWSLGNIGIITDNLGNKYFDGSSSSSNGIISKNVRTISNFNNAANTLIISYDSYNRKYKVEIPLKEGEIK